MASLQRKLQLAQERIRIQNDTIAQHQIALEEAQKKAIDSESALYGLSKLQGLLNKRLTCPAGWYVTTSKPNGQKKHCDTR